jgi:hypothetical protein
MDGSTGAAAIARSAYTDDPKPGRYMIEHLADGLTDRMQRAAAVRTVLMVDIKPQVLAGRCAGMLARSVCDLILGALTAADGSVASARAISAPRSSKPSCSWSSSSRSARRPNWLRCSFATMRRSRSISACAARETGSRPPSRSPPLQIEDENRSRPIAAKQVCEKWTLTERPCQCRALAAPRCSAKSISLIRPNNSLLGPAGNCS